MSSLVKAYASMPFLETKRAALDIGKVDAEGVFEGYASLFGVLDLGGDMVMPGAFGDGLRILGANGVKMLWQHDPAQQLDDHLRPGVGNLDPAAVPGGLCAGLPGHGVADDGVGA